MKIPVLSYHSISNDNCPLSLNINKFEKQLIYLKNKKYQSINFDEVNLKKEKQIIITFDDGYKNIISNCLPLLKKYNFKAICFIVTNFIGKNNSWDSNNKNIISKELMNKENLNEWINSGMTLGSHSHDHYDLTKLNYNEIRYQIEKSKGVLEDLSGTEINSFCYPYGKYNSNIHVQMTDSSTYSNAFTTNRSRYVLDRHDKYLIPRIDMGKPYSKFKIYLKLETIYEDVKYNEFQISL